MTQTEFDFRSPPAGELERSLGTWLGAFCRKASASVSFTLPFPAEWSLARSQSISGRLLFQQVSADAIGIPLSTSDEADGIVVVAMSRPVLLALISGMFGETEKTLPADRDPTDLESSLIGLLATQLIAQPLEQSWPGSESLQFSVGSAGPLSAIRPARPSEMILSAQLNFSAPFGEQTIHLLFPRSGRWERLAIVSQKGRAPSASELKQMEVLVRDMAVELAVVLGNAEMTMSEVAELRVGDLIVLRQRIGEPLDGLVSGSRKFRVWPGAVGQRAAVQIEAIADD